MEQIITIRPANSNDYAEVITLLQQDNLPVEDIDPQLPHFFVSEENGHITAAAGLEVYTEGALLRSVVVHISKRNQGLASRLLEELFPYATRQSINKLFLITTTAEKYFLQKGFIKTGRDNVPASVLQSKEFNGLCPSSATIMFRSL